MNILHTIAHLLGIDTQTSYFYAFYSGIGAVLLGRISLLYVQLRRHNCEVHRCWRIGKLRTAAGHMVCRHHKPGGAPTAKQVRDDHHMALTRATRR